MEADRAATPDDIAALKVALAEERTKALEVAAELAVARAKAAEDTALIAHQKLQIAKLTRQLYGQKSERASRIDQLALSFEEAEIAATEDELAAEKAVAALGRLLPHCLPRRRSMALILTHGSSSPSSVSPLAGPIAISTPSCPGIIKP